MTGKTDCWYAKEKLLLDTKEFGSFSLETMKICRYNMGF